MKARKEKNSRQTLSFIKRLLWCLILAGLFFSLLSAPAAYAQTNIYKSLQYPFYDPEKASGTTVGNCSADLIGSNVGQQVFNFFIGVGLEPWQAAGIIGNMVAESGLEPQRLEGTLPGTITPAENFSGSLGWGIVQWTPGSKMIDNFSPKSQANDLAVQLQFLWDQLEGRGPIPEKQAGKDVKAAKDVENATVAFQGTNGGIVVYNGISYGPYYGFERPKNVQATIKFRIDTAKDALATYGNNSSPGGGLSCDTSTPAGATIDMANLYKDSTNVGCAPPTRNIGIYDGYANKVLVKIRLCALPNLPSSGQESNGGYGVTGGNGDALVNSRVSGAWYALVEAARKTLPANLKLTANSTFRTMAHQQYLCSQDAGCSGSPPNYSTVAEPGKSNHQMGLAIDFDIKGISETRSACIYKNGVCTASGYTDWEWLNSNASKFGFNQYENEFWHFSPTGS